MEVLKNKLLANVDISAETGCWNWTAGKHPKGYGHIRSGGKIKAAHRVSYEIHCGTIEDGLHVCHRCDNPACINPDHLFLGSNVDNMADKIAKGRQSRLHGADNGKAKLTDTAVRAIRAAKGIPSSELANKYGVNRSQIWLVRTGKRWTHIS